MKNTRNRLTPFLIIILIVLVWILIGVIAFKLIKKNNNNIDIKKLKLDDDLVQELYSYITDDDIINFSTKKYDSTNLPAEFIIKKATNYMTIEDIKFLNGNKISISYEALDGAIKRAFGPSFKYDFKNIDISVNTKFSLDGKKLIFNLKYDKASNSYLGTYKEYINTGDVLVKHDLVRATMDKNIDFKIGYVFYKKSNKYQICDDYKCNNIIKEVDDINSYEYDKFVIINLKKDSDDSYYYNYNS